MILIGLVIAHAIAYEIRQWLKRTLGLAEKGHTTTQGGSP